MFVPFSIGAGTSFLVGLFLHLLGVYLRQRHPGQVGFSLWGLRVKAIGNIGWLLMVIASGVWLMVVGLLVLKEYGLF